MFMNLICTHVVLLSSAGKKTVTVDLAKEELESADLEALVLGRSGNLRAPSARMGKTWIVGYGEETWTSHFD